MTPRSPPSGSPFGAGSTPFLWAGCLLFLGLLGDLPFPAGLFVAGVGVLASTLWQSRRSARGSSWAIVPGLGALSLLVATSVAAPTTDLVAGVSGLAFLLWVADDPARPSGGARRATPAVAIAALAGGLAWSTSLVAPGGAPDIGVAAGLIVLGIVLTALLFRSLRPRTSAAAALVEPTTPPP